MQSSTFEGPVAGPGAKMSWVGDPATVGSGSQTIIESRPHDLVRMNLAFEGEGTADERMTFASDGPMTRVTWSVESDLGFNPVSRYFGMFFDRMMGPDFEQGLTRLKALAEAGPKTDVGGLQAEVTTVRSMPIAFVEATSAQDDQAIAEAIGGAMARVGVFMSTNGLQQASPPITINRQWQQGSYAFDAAIPIDRLPAEPITADSPVKVKGTYAGPVAKAVHRGAYSGLPTTYEKLLAWIALNGYQAAGDPWDEYVSDPTKTAQPEVITNVYFPIK